MLPSTAFNLQLSLTEILLVPARSRIRSHGMTQKGSSV
jgi:hypothetical protein